MQAGGSGVTATSTTGYTLAGGGGDFNKSGFNYASFNFRAAPNFFDIVTYSGTGSPMTVAHNLGSVPGMMMIKMTNDTPGWFVYHKELGIDNVLSLQSNTDVSTLTGSNQMWASTPTSSEFYLGPNVNIIDSGKEYIAYLFADTPGLIKCGTVTTGAGNTPSPINSGFRPAWILIKGIDSNTYGGGPTDWDIHYLKQDNNSYPTLQANAKFEESSSYRIANVSDTGFDYYAPRSYSTFVYVAIAENAMAATAAPMGTLTADANPSDPSITMKDVTGSWTSGISAVGKTELTKYSPSPQDITFTSKNSGTTPFNGTDATLAFRKWTLETRASAGDPWTVVDIYEDYDVVASQDGATPWSSNKPTLSPNTLYRIKVAYHSATGEPVESVYHTFETGSA